MKHPVKKIILAAALILAAWPAEAKLWKIDVAPSRLSFTGTQTKTPFTGTFDKYTASVDFDPAQPGTAKIDVTIDMASAKTGDVQRDEALPGSDWFDVKAFPHAVFHASTVVAAPGASSFLATGTLTIKGITKNVTLPFTLLPHGAGMEAKGTLVIDRADYNVGTGDWASDAYVGKPVTITLDLIAQ